MNLQHHHSWTGTQILEKKFPSGSEFFFLDCVTFFFSNGEKRQEQVIGPQSLKRAAAKVLLAGINQSGLRNSKKSNGLIEYIYCCFEC